MAAVRCFSETFSPIFGCKSRFSPVTFFLSLHYPKARSFICSDSRAPPQLPLRAQARVSDSQLKEDWLDSLTCPFPDTDGGDSPAVHSGWVIGIDPDLSGALALLKPDPLGCSAQVFDTPYLQVLVGKKVRKRLDTRSIVQLLRSFDAPVGSTAYIEQSRPFPQDGKQGWWSGGFTYGLWIGILVASGFSVVPVCSRVWKDQYELYNNSSTKQTRSILVFYIFMHTGLEMIDDQDLGNTIVPWFSVFLNCGKSPHQFWTHVSSDDSRKAASILFPSLSSSLKRKKDHGRADALLIAAYARGLKLEPSPISL